MKPDGLITSGNGIVMPAIGGNRPLAQRACIVIKGRDVSGHIACLYPDGFVRHHEAANMELLLGKITAQIRARHQVGAIEFLSVPTSLDAGGKIEIRS